MKPLRILTEASASLTSSYLINAIREAGHIACGSDIDDFSAYSSAAKTTAEKSLVQDSQATQCKESNPNHTPKKQLKQYKQMYDDFILMPRADDPHLWEKTLALLQKHRIDVVIPTLDESLLGWSERKELFAKYGITVLISPPRTIETFIDKWKSYEFFTAHHIPTPKTALYNHYGILKPRFGRGGKGIMQQEAEIFYTGGGAR